MAVLISAPVLPTLRIEVPVSPLVEFQNASGSSAVIAPLATLAAIVDEIGADPDESLAADDECCSQHESTGVAPAAEEPRGLLVPQAPPAIGVISPPRAFPRICRGHGPAREGLRGRSRQGAPGAEAGAVPPGAA